VKNAPSSPLAAVPESADTKSKTDEILTARVEPPTGSRRWPCIFMDDTQLCTYSCFHTLGDVNACSAWPTGGSCLAILVSCHAIFVFVVVIVDEEQEEEDKEEADDDDDLLLLFMMLMTTTTTTTTMMMMMMMTVMINVAVVVISSGSRL